MSDIERNEDDYINITFGNSTHVRRSSEWIALARRDLAGADLARLTEENAALRIPAELDDDLRWILGRPCFAIIGIVEILRKGGQEIAKKAEAEQAAAIHWMLLQYAKHGKDWRKKGEEALSAIDATIKEGS